MTTAAHGFHIANLILGTLWAIEPDLFHEGRVHVSTPPLYGISHKSNPNDRIYIKNEASYVDFITRGPLFKAIDVTYVMTPQNVIEEQLRTHPSHHVMQSLYDLSVPLDIDSLVSLMSVVLEAGPAIDNLASELRVTSYIVEALAHIYDMLDNPHLPSIAQALGGPDVVDNLKYDSLKDVLTISIGMQDYIIPLLGVRTSLRPIVRILKKLNYQDLHIWTVYKNIPDQKEPIYTSLYRLYHLFKQCAGEFSVERYKGLGSMDQADCYKTGVDPAFRSTVQVLPAESGKVIDLCLGSDPAFRRTLVTVSHR